MLLPQVNIGYYPYVFEDDKLFLNELYSFQHYSLPTLNYADERAIHIRARTEPRNVSLRDRATYLAAPSGRRIAEKPSGEKIRQSPLRPVEGTTYTQQPIPAVRFISVSRKPTRYITSRLLYGPRCKEKEARRNESGAFL
ncbi:hypothetical protein Trydic_g20042 [Trypoxylus dichotomus]